ncbi:MAG: transglycosylase domain-containing protein, partial [Acidimicrobiia bacterium]|nr:transglycosylase domain-containing protein [Acidimicrobiia bacterium]
MTTFVPGPLSGPAPLRNRRRNPLWRFRRLLFVLAVLAGAGMAVLWSFASQVELTSDDFDDLIETTYICTAEVEFECGADVAANQLALDGEDRVKVSYGEIPELVIQAVVATEDKNFFQHQGADPVGLARAAFQVAKQKITGATGSLQGGSTITQQYIKLTSGDQADDLARKGREIVRAIKFEQELADELGSKEAAKQEIMARYL